MKKVFSLVGVLIFMSIVGLAVQETKGPAKKSTAKEAVDCTMVDDTKLTAEVKDRFANTKTLKEANLGVAARTGKVTLTGKVQKGVTKGLATRQAKRVPCVKEVDNQITVETAATKKPK